MKILHTSDWHLGHMLYDYDRREEHEDMLRQICETVRKRQPDLFLLCGDVFHTSQPSAAVQKMFVDAMMEIRGASPKMTMVVTSGNHDSGSRHEIYRNPLKSMDVHMVGMIDRDNPENHIIEIPGKGIVVAVPYANERNIPEGFVQHLLDKALKRSDGVLPVIMTAHTTVSGFDFKGHDDVSDYSVGGIDYVSLDKMGEGFDYLALGHIHHAQTIKSGGRVARYSGSPLPVSFDEAYPHTLTWVEIDKHGDEPIISEVGIENPKPLITLPKEEYMSWETAKELLKDFPSEVPAYIRLNVEVKDFLPPGAHGEAINLLTGKEAKFCLINPRRKGIVSDEKSMMSIEEFREKDPLELVKAYAKDMGIDFDADMENLFRQCLEGF